MSDANSTAYQYPMVDAKVFRDSSGAIAAEVPLVSVLAGNSLQATLTKQLNMPHTSLHGSITQVLTAAARCSMHDR